MRKIIIFVIMERSLDTIGEILWFLMLLHPLITIPLVWKFSKGKKMLRLLDGFLLSLLISFFLGVFSITLLLRNGLGPA